MTATQRRAPQPQGEALVQELKWVHSMIRKDLRAVRRMAADVTAGLPAKQIRSGIRALAANGPIWQLKVNCLQYCSFVHAHHNGESAMVFPALRRSNPALNPVVDRLEADHAKVSDLLDQVDGAARALGQGEDAEIRRRLSDALHNLSRELLAHLDYEEEQISDTLRTWKHWPHR